MLKPIKCMVLLVGTVFSTIFMPCEGNAQFVQQGAKLVGTGAVGAAEQGRSVALSADGNTMITGGAIDDRNIGAAWIFTRTSNVWTQQGPKLVGSAAVGTSQQGYSVGLSTDGNTAIVGGFSDNNFVGAAWIFTRSNGVWSQQGGKLVGTGTAGNARQGFSVALSGDGNTAILGGYTDNDQIGAAWVFTRSNGVWSQQGSKLVGTGSSGVTRQGYSVALSADGSTAFLGSERDAWAFARSGNVWTQQSGKLVGGTAVALSADGNTAIAGSEFDNEMVGAAFVYTRSGGVWSQQGSKLVGTGASGNSYQGSSVALSADGNKAIVGAFADNGSVGASWVYTRANGTWSQQGGKIGGTGAIGGLLFQGISVALSADGNTALIGGHGDNGRAGATWVFVDTGPTNPNTGVTLTSGQSADFRFPALFSTLYNGTYSFRIDVPAGATALTIRGSGTPPSSSFLRSTEFGLFVRYGQDVALQNGSPVFDYQALSSTTPALTINLASNPPLRAGAYYICIAPSTFLFAGTQIQPLTGSILASVTRPAASRVRMISGDNQSGVYETLLPDPLVFAVEDQAGAAVPGATVSFTGSNATVTPASAISDANGRVQATVKLGSILGPANATAAVSGATSVIARFTVTGPGSTALEKLLIPGQPVFLSYPASDTPKYYLGSAGFRFAVPQGSTGYKVTLADPSGVASFSLYSKLGSPPIQLQPNGITLFGGAFATNPGPTVSVEESGAGLAGTYYLAIGVRNIGRAVTGTLTLTITGPTCSYTLQPTSVQIPAAGSQGSVTVTTTAGCAWSAVSDSTWLSLTSATSAGSGTFSYNASANPQSAVRSAQISVGGQTITVTQAGGGQTCSYATQPNSLQVTAAGGQGSVSVTTTAGCAWSAASDSTWLSLTGATGSGSGLFSYAASANPLSTSRSAQISIGGQRITATQAGATGAYRVRVVSGGDQSGLPGARLSEPLVVAIENSAGAPGAGFSIFFAGSNATPSPASATSDANGRAQVTVTLGPVVGAAAIAAAATGATTGTANFTVLPLTSAVSIASVVNGASFLPEVAPQSWISIRGAQLSNTTRTWAASDFQQNILPTVLDGVRVRINGKDAAVAYISPTQINALSPYDTTVGPVEVSVTSPSGVAQATVQLRRTAPSFFLFDPDNRKYLAAVHPDGAYAAKSGLFGAAVATRPFSPGGRALLFGTGFGDTNLVTPTDRVFQGAAPLARNVVVRIGGIQAVVEFAGLVGVGLYQFNLIIPAALSDGDHAVVAEVDGVSSGSGSFLTVVNSTPAPPPDLPDLVMTEVTAPTSAIIGKQLGSVRVTVTNRGVAPSTKSFRAGFYFSTDARITTEDIRSAFSCLVSAPLAPGASSSCVGPIDLPIAVGSGVWYFGAIADHLNEIVESDESNNAAAASTGAITVDSPPAINLASTPTALGFTAIQGGPPTAGQILTITTPSPGQSLRFRSNASWLLASLTEGSSPATISISANPASLAVGYYAGEITVFSLENPNSVLQVSVGFSVSPATSQSRLSVTPSSLQFSHRVGESGVSAQRLSLAAVGPVGFSTWTLAGVSDGVGWLRSSGSAQPGGVDVGVDSNGMSAGVYRGYILVFGPQYSNPLIQVPVTLTIGQN